MYSERGAAFAIYKFALRSNLLFMKNRLLFLLLIVQAFWFFMFSPWTAPLINFWIGITIAAITVLTLTSILFPEWRSQLPQKPVEWVVGAAIGVVLAALLWGVFWLGDKISAWVLPFTVKQVDTIYELGNNINAPLVGLALLFIVGPAEEIFWRGTFQRKLSDWRGPNWGFIGMLICYSLVHIWSFNFMLVMAAAVAGGFQGLVYRLFPKSLWPLIVSHALWDVAVFLVFPI